MRSLKLTIAYDGTDYFGWQVQPDRRTVQGVLEQAWGRVAGHPVRVVGSGRTDAGVHAFGQVASCQTDCPLDCDSLRRALNASLPRDVAVREVAEAPDNFHAIRDAVSKRYRYAIDDGPVPDVLARRYSWYFPQRLDISTMHRAAQQLFGTHDFASFATSGSPRYSTVRTISEISVDRRSENERGGERVVIEMEANGFLYNMARAIVGTLVDVGRGSQSESWIYDVLAAQNRRMAGITAPPQGLFLVRVTYQ